MTREGDRNSADDQHIGGDGQTYSEIFCGRVQNEVCVLYPEPSIAWVQHIFHRFKCAHGHTQTTHEHTHTWSMINFVSSHIFINECEIVAEIPHTSTVDMCY